MNIQEALQWGQRQLGASPTAAADSRLLLQYVLAVSRSYLAAHGERPLTAPQVQRLAVLLARAQQGEPVPYLTGRMPFYDLDFVVTPAVLIPRPETEQLVAAALAWAQETGARALVDVGTGSGCIAVTLARHLPHARVQASDVAPAALAVARHNARRHGVTERITFHLGSLLEPVRGTPDLIVANLPYVAGDEWTVLDDGVKWYEPAGALRGGSDGLDLIRKLLRQARTRLRPGGAIFLEIGWRQGPAAQQLACSIFPASRVTVKPDYAGHNRIVAIET